MDAKAIRKQIRNVLQEQQEDILNSIIGQAITKEMTTLMNTRLDNVENFVKSSLDKMDKRSRDVQGYLVGVVKNTVQAQIADVDLTINAVVSVMSDSGIIIEGFDQKVKDKKVAIKTAETQAASDAAIAATAARAAAAEAAKNGAPQADAALDLTAPQEPSPSEPAPTQDAQE